MPHGGNFDGAAGVVAGLVAVAALQRAGIALDRDLTVMGIRAEESIWFQVSYIGSRGALGTLPDGALDVRRIDTGRTLAEHIAECGGDPEALRAGARYLDPARLAGYLELHIEQAPSLVEAGRRSRSAPAFPATSAIPTRASRAATTMSACRAASAATLRWRAPNSPWRSTDCGRNTKRAASRWPARSAASTPMPPCTG